MDWGTAAQCGGVVLSLAAIFIAWVNRRNDAIKNAEDRLDRHDQRIQKVESEVAHLPGKDLVFTLQLSMAELKGQMAVVVERVGPIKAVADRMQEMLMTEGSRK